MEIDDIPKKLLQMHQLLQQICSDMQLLLNGRDGEADNFKMMQLREAKH